MQQANRKPFSFRINLNKILRYLRSWEWINEESVNFLVFISLLFFFVFSLCLLRITTHQLFIMPHLWESDTTVTSSVFQFSNHFILYSREIEPKYIQEEFNLMSNFTSTHGNRMKSALRTKLPNMAGPFIEAFKNISSIVYISTTIVLLWLFINFHIDLLETPRDLTPCFQFLQLWICLWHFFQMAS